MKKFLAILAVLLLSGICLRAQITYVDNEGVQSSLNQKIDQKRCTFDIDLGVGSAVDVGFHIQRNFIRHISWDIFCTRYSWQFNQNSHQFYALTGVRFFTSPFGQRKHMKVFFAMDLGYGGFSYKQQTRYSQTTSWQSRFVFAPEVGIYLSDHFYLGAAATHLVNSYSVSPYVLRLGFEF